MATPSIWPCRRSRKQMSRCNSSSPTHNYALPRTAALLCLHTLPSDAKPSLRIFNLNSSSPKSATASPPPPAASRLLTAAPLKLRSTLLTDGCPTRISTSESSTQYPWRQRILPSPLNSDARPSAYSSAQHLHARHWQEHDTGQQRRRGQWCTSCSRRRRGCKCRTTFSNAGCLLISWRKTLFGRDRQHHTGRSRRPVLRTMSQGLSFQR
jgi:hypothetical protein